MLIFFRGDVEKKVGGKNRLFRFNMAAITLLGDLQNAPLTQLAVEVSNPKMSTVANFLYAGAYTYARQEKKMIDFSQDDATEWLNEIGLDVALEMLGKAFEVPEPEKDKEKNQTAP